MEGLFSALEDRFNRIRRKYLYRMKTPSKGNGDIWTPNVILYAVLNKDAMTASPNSRSSRYIHQNARDRRLGNDM